MDFLHRSYITSLGFLQVRAFSNRPKDREFLPTGEFRGDVHQERIGLHCLHDLEIFSIAKCTSGQLPQSGFRA